MHSIGYLTVLAEAGWHVGEALNALHSHRDQICHLYVKVRPFLVGLPYFRTLAVWTPTAQTA